MPTSSNKPQKNCLAHFVLEIESKQYDCTGVIMEETPDRIRVAFNAIEDVVRDSLELDRSEIIRMETIDDGDIVEIDLLALTTPRTLAP